MNTQKVEPCEFVAGLCSNCGASERGACEGWIAPDDRVHSLGEQIEALTKERDELQEKITAMCKAIPGYDWGGDSEKWIADLAAAAKLALEASLQVYATCDWYGDDGREAIGALSEAINTLRQAGVQ